MAETEASDVSINGSGATSGGRYNRVRINGSGKINGDMECAELSINGSGTVAGSVKAERLHISGSGRIAGDVNAEEMKTSGSSHIEGSVAGGSVKVSGSSDIGGGVDVREVRVSGSVQIAENCNAEHFHSAGVFTIGGLLNADEVEIRLHWRRSRAREIGGGRIDVRLDDTPGFALLKSVFSFGAGAPGLEADLIEGDEVHLEYTKARTVRGARLLIGPGCDIGEVEYKESLEKSDDAKVGNEKKV